MSASILLTYNFAIAGVDQVKQAIEGVEAKFVRSESAQQRISRSRTSADREAVEAKKKALKEEQALAKAEEKAAKDKLKDIKRAEDEQIRSAKRVAKEREREELKALKTIEREQKREEKRQEAARRDFARGVVGSAGGSLRSSVGGIMRLAGAGLGIVGGLAVGDSISRGVDDQKRVRALSIAGNHQLNDKQIDDVVTREAIRTGQDKAALIEQLSQYVAISGDLKGGVAKLEAMNNTALASGADPAEIGKASGLISANFNIDSLRGMGEALAALNEQGKAGSVEFRELSTYMGNLGSIAKKMGMDTGEGLKVVAGMTQAIRPYVASTAEAVTSQEAFLAESVKHSKDIGSGKSFGGKKVNVFKDKSKTQLKDYRELIVDYLGASGGNLAQLEHILGREGTAAITPFQSTYVKAMEAASGSKADKKKAGEAAVRAQYDTAINPGQGRGYAGLQQDAFDAQNTLAGNFAKAKNQFDQEITKALIPVLEKLTPKLSELVPLVGKAADMFVKFVEQLSNNPWTTVMGLVGAHMVADVGQAAIGKAVGSALTNLIASSMAGSGASAAGTALSSVASGAGGIGSATVGAAASGIALPLLAGAALAVGTIMVGNMLVDHADMKKDKPHDIPTNDDKPKITPMFENPNKVTSLDDLYAPNTNSKDVAGSAQHTKAEDFRAQLSAAQAQKEAADKQLEAAKLMSNLSKQLGDRQLPTGRDPGDPH